MENSLTLSALLYIHAWSNAVQQTTYVQMGGKVLVKIQRNTGVVSAPFDFLCIELLLVFINVFALIMQLCI